MIVIETLPEAFEIAVPIRYPGVEHQHLANPTINRAMTQVPLDCPEVVEDYHLSLKQPKGVPKVGWRSAFAVFVVLEHLTLTVEDSTA